VTRTVTIRVEGDPVPKGRPRHTLDGHTYTPKRTKEYEDAISVEWLKLDPSERAPFTGPVRVTVGVRERVYPADLDNYCKIVLDALNGLAWADDVQVEAICASIIRRHSPAGVTVTVEEIE